MKLTLQQLLSQKITDYQKTPLERALTLLSILDIDSITHYKEELLLRNYLTKLTANSKLQFSEILMELHNLPKTLIYDLVEQLPKVSNNRYLQEIFNQLNIIIDPNYVKVETDNIEDTEIYFTDLIIFMIYEIKNHNQPKKEGEDLFFKAILEDNLQMFKAFYTNGEIDINVRNYYNESLLHLTCMQNARKIFKYLVELGLDIEDKSDEGITPLHKACEFNSKACVETIINYGVNLDITDNYGNTPLHYACFKKNKEVIKLLIDNGANIEIKNN
ncbi:MAG: ankyrin repeat domain-containing protein, partial [Bacilli bacterium]|nr:ankyrin repeat domain-containing protein [Bacilli bacterium]